MAGLTVTAQAHETLDHLVWRHLGTVPIEPVFEANPGLAELGPFLPEGHPVFLPDIKPAPAEVSLVTLWD